MYNGCGWAPSPLSRAALPAWQSASEVEDQKRPFPLGGVRGRTKACVAPVLPAWGRLSAPKPLKEGASALFSGETIKITTPLFSPSPLGVPVHLKMGKRGGTAGECGEGVPEAACRGLASSKRGLFRPRGPGTAKDVHIVYRSSFLTAALAKLGTIIWCIIHSDVGLRLPRQCSRSSRLLALSLPCFGDAEASSKPPLSASYQRPLINPASL